jgi:hypothetical protein
MACARMRKREERRVQRLTLAEDLAPSRLNAKEMRVGGWRAIQGIAQQRITPRGQVDPDLVGTARLELARHHRHRTDCSRACAG